MFSLLMGLTVTVFGVALLAGRTYPKWMGGLAIIGCVPTAVGGVAMAYTGFSGIAMAINMPASSILLAWILPLGVLMWRRRLGEDETAVWGAVSELVGHINVWLLVWLNGNVRA